MHSINEKQKFIRAMANNAGYFNKDLISHQVLQFLKANPDYSPRQAVRTNPNQGIFSFIEIYGFVQLGNDFYEILIGMPRNYPHSPPIFMIAVDRQYCSIYDEQTLLNNKLIAFEKDEKGQQYVRLRFPLIQKNWQPQNASLAAIFKNLTQMIKKPQLIRSKYQKQKSMQRSPQKYRKNKQKSVKNIKSKQITSAIAKIYNDYTQMLIQKQNIQQNQQKIDYALSRYQFMKQTHLNHINLQMNKYESRLKTAIQEIQEDLNKVKSNKDMTHMLQGPQNDNNQLKKIGIISEHQALKDAEIAIRSKIQSQQSQKFSDSKKILKILFDRMFDNQTQMLKMS